MGDFNIVNNFLKNMNLENMPICDDLKKETDKLIEEGRELDDSVSEKANILKEHEEELKSLVQEIGLLEAKKDLSQEEKQRLEVLYERKAEIMGKIEEKGEL